MNKTTDLHHRLDQTRGFTLVELLIVIVVVAILAAITIVAYSGITSRAYTAKSQTAAESAQKVAEAMNADNGFYPALATATGCSTTPTTTTTCLTLGSLSTKLPSGMTVGPDEASPGPTPVTNMTAALSLNGTVVYYSCYLTCTASTGGRIAYWNFTTGAPAYTYVGAAVASGAFVAPAH